MMIGFLKISQFTALTSFSRIWLLAVIAMAGLSTASHLIITEEAKLLGRAYIDRYGEPSSNSAMGRAVAISGDTVIAGAPGDSEVDDDAGAAYIFSRNADGSWSEEAKLLSDSIGFYSGFGRSVDIDGDTAIVGVWEDDLAPPDAGHVFVRDASGDWTEQAVLRPQQSVENDKVAYEVAVDDDTALVSRSGVGGWLEEPLRAGSVLVFVRDPSGNWAEQAELFASDGEPGDRFGSTFAIDGDTALISGSGVHFFVRNESGLWTEQLSVSGVSLIGVEGTFAAVRSDEFVHLFVRDSSGQWSERSTIELPSGRGEFFVNDGLMFVKTVNVEDTDAIGAAVYRQIGSEWIEIATLVASDREERGPGGSEDVDGDLIVFGASDDNDTESRGGAAYVFSLTTATPVALDDGPYTLDEGDALSGGRNILDNDSAPGDASLTPVVEDPPAHASFFEVMPNGMFDYTHDGSETTADSFTYRASDGVNESEPATVTLDITPVNDAPEIRLLGDSTITVVGGAVFEDPGAVAEDAEDGDISESIVVGGDTVDTSVERTYVITYNVTDSEGLAAEEVTRTVIVEIDDPPVITLIGSETVTIEENDTYEEPGATATDPEDGDLTDSIVIDNPVDTATPGTYVITYSVEDSSGNQASAERTVIVEEAPPPPPDEAPTISLIGPATVTITEGDSYIDEGATATDAEDGDLTDQVQVDNPVDSSTPATYTVTYTVEDSAGNTAQAKRSVIVEQAATAPPTQTADSRGGGGGAVSQIEFFALLFLGWVIGALRRCLSREARLNQYAATRFPKKALTEMRSLFEAANM